MCYCKCNKHKIRIKCKERKTINIKRNIRSKRMTQKNKDHVCFTQALSVVHFDVEVKVRIARQGTVCLSSIRGEARKARIEKCELDEGFQPYRPPFRKEDTVFAGRSPKNSLVVRQEISRALRAIIVMIIIIIIIISLLFRATYYNLYILVALLLSLS